MNVIKEKSWITKCIKNEIPLIFSMLLLVYLWLLPTGYEDAIIYQDRIREKVEILEVDNGAMVIIGSVTTGDQKCTVRVLDGVYRGQEKIAVNMLTGSIETDKIFQVGEIAYGLITLREEEIFSISLVDHYRLDSEFLLLGLFFSLIVLVGGKTGIRSLFGFGITILMIWKILIPQCLNGSNPILVSFCIITSLTVVIISLVFGFTRQMMVATIGSLSGTLITLIMAYCFTDIFSLTGAILPESQSLFFSGFPHLNLKALFVSSVFVASSGAVMDLAVDITSAVEEVVQKKPDISTKEAVASGMTVGRNAMGTMTTTLLLAYSGGYLALLMVFMAQGTPLDNILNYKFVASEILDTLVGSFGLIMVVPTTALSAGVLLTDKKLLHEWKERG